MNIKDDYYRINDCMNLAEQVEDIQEGGRCSESSAALIVIAEQLQYIARGLNQLNCIVSRLEAEWEEQK